MRIGIAVKPELVEARDTLVELSAWLREPRRRCGVDPEAASAGRRRRARGRRTRRPAVAGRSRRGARRRRHAAGDGEGDRRERPRHPDPGGEFRIARIPDRDHAAGDLHGARGGASNGRGHARSAHDAARDGHAARTGRIHAHGAQRRRLHAHGAVADDRAVGVGRRSVRHGGQGRWLDRRHAHRIDGLQPRGRRPDRASRRWTRSS